jgi:hypothetical protein
MIKLKLRYALKIIRKLNLERKVFVGEYYLPVKIGARGGMRKMPIIWTYSQEIANRLEKYFGVAHMNRDWTGKFYFYWFVRR